VKRQLRRDLNGVEARATALFPCFYGVVEQVVWWPGWTWAAALPVDHEQDAVRCKYPPHLGERVLSQDLVQQVHGEDPIGLTVAQGHAVGCDPHASALPLLSVRPTGLAARQHHHLGRCELAQTVAQTRHRLRHVGVPRRGDAGRPHGVECDIETGLHRSQLTVDVVGQHVQPRRGDDRREDQGLGRAVAVTAG